VHKTSHTICFLFLVALSVGNAQTFSTNTSLPFDLDGGTSYSTCSSPGTKAFNFTVSGLSTLNTSTNQLAEIKIRLDASCGSNIRDVACYIKSPSGVCVQLASTMGTTTNYSSMPTTYLDYCFRNTVACLNKAPDYSAFPSTTGSEENQDGRYGVFSTVGNLTSSFNGVNPNGTWTLYFYENTSFAPCVVSASIFFGNVASSDQTSNGDACVTAINWNGSPICASTTGKTSSSNMPLWNGSGFNTGCDWNAANNNDVWIKFQPSSANVCLSISGLVDNLQSIIVTDPNSDGDNNPCTGAGGGGYWTIVNCPRTSDNIYAAATGTTRNQNHCFTATVGKTYYLVVDGNGGAESPFYLSGTVGTFSSLPIELLSFDARLENKATHLTWQTASERNNDYFSVERSANGIDWSVIETVEGAGSSTELLSYETFDVNPLRGISYYRLKQTDFDGKTSYSEIRTISNTSELMILPNPGSGVFYISGLSDRKENTIVVRDITGKAISEMTIQNEMHQLDLTQHPAGLYFVTVNAEETIRVIKLKD